MPDNGYVAIWTPECQYSEDNGIPVNLLDGTEIEG